MPLFGIYSVIVPASTASSGSASPSSARAEARSSIMASFRSMPFGIYENFFFGMAKKYRHNESCSVMTMMQWAHSAVSQLNNQMTPFVPMKRSSEKAHPDRKSTRLNSSHSS